MLTFSYMVRMMDVGLIPCSAPIDDGLPIFSASLTIFSFARCMQADVTSMGSGMMHVLAKRRYRA